MYVAIMASCLTGTSITQSQIGVTTLSRSRPVPTPLTEDNVPATTRSAVAPVLIATSAAPIPARATVR
ncbi:hypothetical protein D3C80_1638970 [compost metagenome]